MIYIDFALAVYPQRRRGGSGSGPYERPRGDREQEWGLMKLLLGTTYKHLEEDLQMLAAPERLSVTTDDEWAIRLYRCERLRWDVRYPEIDRIKVAVRELGTMRNMCVEVLAIHAGSPHFSDQLGRHSNVLQTVHAIKVDL